MDSSSADEPLVALLRLCARVHCDADDLERVAEAARRVTDWAPFPPAAEAHGLAPLALLHLTRAFPSLPIDARQHLFALAAHHRRRSRAHVHAVREAIEAFDRAAIAVLVLKGAALAHVLYESPDLRPLSDVDLLVAPDDAARAQTVLRELGYDAPWSAPTRILARHHHLPAARKACDGYMVQVELHTDALSHDAPGTLTLSSLSARPRAFSIQGQPARAFGHADMLYHLTRHLAQRARLLRLIWVADVVGYAARYQDEIPWDDVRQRYPFVINALSLLHLVTELPPALVEHVTPARGGRLRGVGVPCRHLSDIFQRGRPVRDITRDLFAPSDWWLRLYYGLDDDAPLWWHRAVVHPRHVGYWLARRAGAWVPRPVRRMSGGDGR